MQSILFLVIAVIAEVFGSTMLKLSEGFSVLLPSLGVILGYTIAFIFLGLSLKSIPLSIAYAIWAAAGTALTVLMGVLLFDEYLNAMKINGLIFIIVGVFILNRSKLVKTDNKKLEVE